MKRLVLSTFDGRSHRLLIVISLSLSTAAPAFFLVPPASDDCRGALVFDGARRLDCLGLLRSS